MEFTHPIIFFGVIGILCAVGFFFSWLTDPNDHGGSEDGE